MATFVSVYHYSKIIFRALCWNLQIMFTASFNLHKFYVVHQIPQELFFVNMSTQRMRTVHVFRLHMIAICNVLVDEGLQ